MSFYDEDLAYIHDSGFSQLSLRGGEFVLSELQAAGLRDGLIVDLGCGTGRWAGLAASAGYAVLGFDASPAMLRLARDRAPGADLRLASLWHSEIPRCVAVTAFGEVLNYGYSQPPDEAALQTLFARIAASLAPSGLLVFDVVVAGEGPSSYRNCSAGEDWAVMVEVTEQADVGALIRKIDLFRRLGQHYRRSQELHRQALFAPGPVRALLTCLGFEVAVDRAYPSAPLGDGRLAFVARRPSQLPARD
jgi:SAM-dependent methyltransferase